MSAHVAPPSALSSMTPPSQPPLSNEKRCEKEITSGPAPTRIVGETSDCSSGPSALTSSNCPLLSGPQNTCWVGESARRRQALMFGDDVAPPAIVHPGFADSNDSVVEAWGTSS